MAGAGDRHDPGGDSGIGRVTDPQRFSVLHDVARSLADRLQRDHLVERQDGGAELDPGLAGRPVVGVFLLRPADPRAAPLTVALTDFPGLVVRFGRWHTEALPQCGCDYCDEDPAALAEELETSVGQLVAGRFSEAVTGRVRRRLEFGFDGRGGWSLLQRGRPPWDEGPARHDWSPWPRRPPAG